MADDYRPSLTSRPVSTSSGIKEGPSNFRSVTATDTLDVNDDTLLCNGTFTVTLPAANSDVRNRYVIKNVGSGTITVDGASAETIDGSATRTLTKQYSSLTIASDGTAWHILTAYDGSETL